MFASKLPRQWHHAPSGSNSIDGSIDIALLKECGT
jgi:hypothetical protein